MNNWNEAAKKFSVDFDALAASYKPTTKAFKVVFEGLKDVQRLNKEFYDLDYKSKLSSVIIKELDSEAQQYRQAVNDLSSLLQKDFRPGQEARRLINETATRKRQIMYFASQHLPYLRQEGAGKPAFEDVQQELKRELEVFEATQELWKHSGFLWQVISDGSSYAVSPQLLCRNCFYELSEDYKCDECGKQYKPLEDIAEAARKAAKSYNADRRRKSYTVRAPQVGEKIAEVDMDLPGSHFMNAKLENRKGIDLVVLTVGKKGESKKAQIFVDLKKNEIRHDQTDLGPQQFISTIELDGNEQNVKKQFQRKSANPRLEHPYIYVSGSSHNNTEITLTIKSDEPDEYFLESIELEGASSSPNKALVAKSITKGIRIEGFAHPFKNPTPKVRLTVSRGGKSFLIEQNIKTGSRADGKYNLIQWVERPEFIKEIG